MRPWPGSYTSGKDPELAKDPERIAWMLSQLGRTSGCWIRAFTFPFSER